MAVQWTKSQDEELLALYRAGRPSGEIAEALGRPRSSVRSRLLVLGELAYGVRQSRQGRTHNTRVTGPGKSVRNCLCCAASFLSDGPHHRLCGRCRTKDTSPYAH